MNKFIWLITMVIFLGPCVSFSSANSALIYELSLTGIKAVITSKNPDGSSDVILILNEQERQIFSEFTAKNIGKSLRIMFNGRPLMEAAIRDRIDSGTVLIGRLNSEEKVISFLESLSLLKVYKSLSNSKSTKRY